MKIHPCGTRVLISSNSDGKTKGGIVLPDGSSPLVKTFTTIEVGPRVNGLKPGDQVMLTHQAGRCWITHEKNLFIVEEDCILAILDSDDPTEKIVL